MHVIKHPTVNRLKNIQILEKHISKEAEILNCFFFADMKTAYVFLKFFVHREFNCNVQDL